VVPHPQGKRASELHVEAMNKYPGRFELVEGDFLAMSVDEIAKDLKGSYGVFLSTNYWKFKDKTPDERADAEYDLGKKVADAAKKAKVMNKSIS
jgi:hypothetical protein